MNRLSRILIELALEEDLRERGDITCESFVDPGHRSAGRIVSREEAILSGLEVAEAVFATLDPGLEFSALASDGDGLAPGMAVCEIRGKTRSLLTAERTALNFLQRLSGVATSTRRYVERIAHTGAVLLDTRKTTPGFRELEKRAVLHGGASNHRAGLYDAVMVKDNHLAANLAPVDLRERAAQVRASHPEWKIEVEADRLDQVAAFLESDAIDVILLDNMNNDQLREAVRLRDESGKAIRLEASGGVTLETVGAIAETGVDFISVGALTHSVRSIDLGLDLVSENA